MQAQPSGSHNGTHPVLPRFAPQDTPSRNNSIDQADSDDGQSADDDNDGDDLHDLVRNGKRKRPISVS